MYTRLADRVGGPIGRHDLVVGATVFVPVALLIIASFVIASLTDVPQERLARDPAAVSGAPWYTGYLSTLGVAGWAIGNAIALFVGVLVSHRSRGLLIGIGSVGLVLTVDDAVMAHEAAITHFGTDAAAEVLYAGYVLALVAVLVRHRALLAGPGALIFGTGSVFLAMSLGSDVVGGPNFLEDALKLMGIAGWTTGLVVRAAAVAREDAVSAVTRQAGRTDRDSVPLPGG